MAKMPDQAANLDQASAIKNDWETGESLSGCSGEGNDDCLLSRVFAVGEQIAVYFRSLLFGQNSRENFFDNIRFLFWSFMRNRGKF
jgi:hypothetical protein